MKSSIEIPSEVKPHVKTWYNNTVQEEKFLYTLDRLSEVKVDEDSVVYVYGAGGQPKTVYDGLKKNPNVEVIWSDFILSGVFKLLSAVMSGYAGLVKIKSETEIRSVFEILSVGSMVGLYIFDKRFENDFIVKVKEKNTDVFKIDRAIWEKDSSFLIYHVDADNAESSTGIYEIVSYGYNCPSELVTIISFGR